MIDDNCADVFREVFCSLSLSIVARMKELNFVEHPAYSSGWNEAAQAYQTHLIENDFHPYLRQFRLSGYPMVGQIRLTLLQSNANLGIFSITDIPQNPMDWSKIWLKKPFAEISLMRAKGWNPFSDRAYFTVGAAVDIKAEAARLTRAIEERLPYLVNGNYDPADRRFVEVGYALPQPIAKPLSDLRNVEMAN